MSATVASSSSAKTVTVGALPRVPAVCRFHRSTAAAIASSSRFGRWVENAVVRIICVQHDVPFWGRSER